MRFVRLHKSLIIIGSTLLLLAGGLLYGLMYVLDNYTITHIYVDGNKHYTSEEIIDIVQTSPLSGNSLFLSFQYRNKAITDIPFVERIDVDIVSRDTVRVHVYEKALAGVIRYLGRYMYFDRDGIVVESASLMYDDVPLVMGLDFDHVVLYEKLPVEKDEVFGEILDITQLLNKYQLKADRIYFDADYRIYLYFGQTEISLGDGTDIDEKVIQLQYILPDLEGKSGVLRLDDYSAANNHITFEERKTLREDNDLTESVKEEDAPVE